MQKNKLTNEQKKILAVLEPQLRSCTRSANLEQAKKITAKIQKLLRPTGHETRLLQAKNWLYETAMEANSLTYAKMGFKGNIQKSNSKTRLNLEATSLLAICYLREGNLEKSTEYIYRAIDSISNIKSDRRREQFHKRLVERLEEESILFGLINEESTKLEINEVNNQAINLIRNKSEDQIYLEMGRAIPPKSINILTDIRDAYVLRLPPSDKKMLPAPINEKNKKDLGLRASAALKRVAWRAICDPNSEIHKAWSEGLSIVYDKKYITAAIITSFNSLNISGVMLAASAVALAIKFGVEVFCETFAPKSIMIARKDKS